MSATTTTLQDCPICSRAIPADAPSGLCPSCMVNQALRGELQNTLNSALGSGRSARSGQGFSGPSVEEVARLLPQLEVEEELGRGGMGVVYLARQTSLDRPVAVKLLPREVAQTPGFHERFQREARSLARLSHPNVVGIYDSGVAGDYAYFVMEYVDGSTLRDLLSSGAISPEEGLELFPQICAGLQFAHDQGVVHRDIKPENLLITEDGRVKIADFGLAKVLGPDSKDPTLTQTNQLMGTPHYLAPEVLRRGSAGVDQRADTYALGVILYEMLAGQLPIGRFAPPSKVGGSDPSLDPIVLRCLEADPDDRFPQVAEVARALEVRAPTLIQTTHALPSQVRAKATPQDLYQVFDATDSVQAWTYSDVLLSIPSLGLLPLLKSSRVFRARLVDLEARFPQTLPAELDPQGRWPDYRERAVSAPQKRTRRRGLLAKLLFPALLALGLGCAFLNANPPMPRYVEVPASHTQWRWENGRQVQSAGPVRNPDHRAFRKASAAIGIGCGVAWVLFLLTNVLVHRREVKAQARHELYLRALEGGKREPAEAVERRLIEHDAQWRKQGWITALTLLPSLFLAVVTLGVLSPLFFLALTRAFAEPLRDSA